VLLFSAVSVEFARKHTDSISLKNVYLMDNIVVQEVHMSGSAACISPGETETKREMQITDNTDYRECRIDSITAIVEHDRSSQRQVRCRHLTRSIFQSFLKFQNLTKFDQIVQISNVQMANPATREVFVEGKILHH